MSILSILSLFAASLLVCVSVLVTIRQRAESLSIRIGADHFLVSHHPGCGIIHLGSGGGDGQKQSQPQSCTFNSRLH